MGRTQGLVKAEMLLTRFVCRYQDSNGAQEHPIASDRSARFPPLHLGAHKRTRACIDTHTMEA